MNTANLRHIQFRFILTIAGLLFALPLALHAQTGTDQSGQAAPDTSASSPASADSAKAESAKMKSVTAVLTSVIDSKKTPTGSQFQAKLQQKVRFENGLELPSGTILTGKVVEDDTQSGNAKLALRFTDAQLKNGQTVPIKATIINVFDVASETGYGSNVPSLTWNGNTVGVDQIDVRPGVDLHSNVSSLNSGVFVSTKKDDIKLSSNTGVELVIAAEGTAQQSAGGN